MPAQRPPFPSVWPWLSCALPALALAQSAPPPPGGGPEHPMHQRMHQTQHAAPRAPHPRMHPHQTPRPAQAWTPAVAAPMTGGIVFSPAQQHMARQYYLQPEHQGFVPPGLAKRGGVPPGQRKHWRVGHVLPAGVAWYALPGTLAWALGPAPEGHRYVRVASDILLIAIGTGLVVDAMEDIVR